VGVSGEQSPGRRQTADVSVSTIITESSIPTPVSNRYTERADSRQWGGQQCPSEHTDDEAQTHDGEHGSGDNR